MARLVTILGGLAMVAAATADERTSPAALRAQAETLQGEAIYPLSSGEAWAAVRALLRELRFRNQKQDDKHQVVITEWRNYDQKVFPDTALLGLPPGDRPQRVQVHMMVSRHHEPARVAAGAILEIERAVEGRRGTAFGYRPPVIEDWLLSELATRAGVRHAPMPADWKARASLAASMKPDDPGGPCVGGLAREPAGKPVRPVKVSDVRPIFPAEGFKSGEGKTVLFGNLTEHGTLTNLKSVNDVPAQAHYQASARAATSLWRFQPMTINGCPWRPASP